jgi:dienelactone hydrolase
MRTFWRALCAIIAFLFLIGTWQLGRLQRMGAPHFDTTLDGGIPATVYIPGKPGGLANIPFPLPTAQRWPVAVLLHGYSADRASVSTLARRLAQNGIAVVSIEFAGHGMNRNPFSPGLTDQTLVKETGAAVAYARSLPLLDASRIIVMGHSMGAGTALDYAQRDKTISGAVMISGGFDLYGPERPRNALFIYAQHDPYFIRMLAREIASKIAGMAQIELNRVYGNPKAGTAVEAIEVPGVDHFTILFSDAAANEILNWCDQLFGISPPISRNLSDPRLRAQLIGFPFFIALLVPVGFGLGAVVPINPKRSVVSTDALIALGGVAGALLAALPLVSTYVPAHFLALDTGDVLISWLSDAGLGIIGALSLTGALQWRSLQEDIRITVLTALFGFALIYAIQVPRDVTLHNLSFTPERLAAFIFSALLLIPFFWGFETLIRRGGPWTSLALGTGGRVIIILVLILGLAEGIMPPLVSVLLPVLVIFMIESEIVSASIYARSGNIAVAALLESAWLAWMIAAIVPITIML